jgi:two-component system sensor histidine kinase DesK
VSAEIADIEAVTQGALVEIREAVTGYRQSTLADELDTARTTLAAAGIEVSAHLSGTPLPAQADGMFGWVVREAATNILRHSQARTCRIRLTRHRDTAVLEVRDDGVGPGESAGTGNGLIGLAERLNAAGGILDTGAAPGKGFQLTVRLPLATGENLVSAPRSPAPSQAIETGTP